MELGAIQVYYTRPQELGLRDVTKPVLNVLGNKTFYPGLWTAKSSCWSTRRHGYPTGMVMRPRLQVHPQAQASCASGQPCHDSDICLSAPETWMRQ
eukprot:1958322-Rhodomonas_salina.1